jgi:hypothetical protein
MLEHIEEVTASFRERWPERLEQAIEWR